MKYQENDKIVRKKPSKFEIKNWDKWWWCKWNV